MTSRDRHDNKQAMREEARKQRAMQAAAQAEERDAAAELFPQPVKVCSKAHDPTAQLAKNVLGDWDRIQPDDLKTGLLGVPRAPGTPQPNKLGKTPPIFSKPSLNGIHKRTNQSNRSNVHSASSDVSKGSIEGRPNDSSKRSEKNSHTNKTQHASRTESGRKNKADSSPVKTERDKSRERSERSKHPTTNNLSHSRHTSHKSSSEGTHLKSQENLANKDTANETHSSPSKLTDHHSVCEEVTNSPPPSIDHQPETNMAPPNGTIPINGLNKKIRHTNLPKIQIHKEGKSSTDPSSSVDDIIKEMTRIDTPLTGISTPHKEKTFPFSSGRMDLSTLQAVSKPLMEGRNHKGGHGKTQGNILNDLELSESESEPDEEKAVSGEVSENVVPVLPDDSFVDPVVKMSSSSDSEESSSSSSESGSDSGSSGSEGEDDAHPVISSSNVTSNKPSPDPTSNSPSEQKSTQGWSLKNFIVAQSGANSIIGADLKNSTDLSENLSKPSGESNGSTQDLHSFTEDLPLTSKPVKKDHHKSSKSRHRSSSSVDQKPNHSPRKASDSQSPAPSIPPPIDTGQSHKSTLKPSPAKRAPRKTSSEKSKKLSKAERNRTSAAKDSVENLSNPPTQRKARGGKIEGRSAGRPRSKPKTPVLLDTDSSSDEEAMDLDVVTITPEKKVNSDLVERNCVDRNSICEKIDFSTPPRDDQSSKLNLPLSPCHSIGRGQRKDSVRKENKERKKHDKQSEDKRKLSPSPDIKTSKYSSQEKDIDICNLDVVKESNFRILSPIPSVPPKSIDGVTYSDGKPSVLVKLNLSLLDRIPIKDTDLKSPESGISTMSSSSSNACSTALSNPISTSLDMTDSREEDRPADLLTDTFNDSAVEDIGELPHKSLKPFIQHESAKDSDNIVTSSKNCSVGENSNVASSESVPDPGEEVIPQFWDTKRLDNKRKRQYPKEGDSKSGESNVKLEKPKEPSPVPDNKCRDRRDSVGKSPVKSNERRNSSNSSHKDKAKRRKCDKSLDLKPTEIKDEPGGVIHENGQVKTENGPTNNFSFSISGQKCASRVKSSHVKLLSAEEYIIEAKKLKHEADSMGDNKDRSLIYTQAVLSFVLSGYSMEQEQIHDTNRCFRMYAETLNLLKCIHVKKMGNSNPDQCLEKPLSVLSLRIQSLLCFKLFKLKKAETLRLKRVIDEHNKTSSKSISSAPSPHQNSWNNRSTGTPSPMSPTPSPAGSIGSVGSQSSSCDVVPSKLGNGTGPVPAAGCISVPQRIHSITSQYITNTGYMIQATDLWDQADTVSLDCSDFFDKLDSQTNILSLNSSMWDLVHYVRQGLHGLQDT